MMNTGRPPSDVSGELLEVIVHFRITAEDNAEIAKIADANYHRNVSEARRALLRLGILAYYASQPTTAQA